MLKPSMSEILGNRTGDYYKFVVAVAKRAREIADIAEAEGEIIDEKPVKLAVEEFAEKKIKLS
jgi:DNA-directed RNA polymerase subunit omega